MVTGWWMDLHVIFNFAGRTSSTTLLCYVVVELVRKTSMAAFYSCAEGKRCILQS